MEGTGSTSTREKWHWNLEGEPYIILLAASASISTSSSDRVTRFMQGSASGSASCGKGEFVRHLQIKEILGIVAHVAIPCHCYSRLLSYKYNYKLFAIVSLHRGRGD